MYAAFCCIMHWGGKQICGENMKQVGLQRYALEKRMKWIYWMKVNRSRIASVSVYGRRTAVAVNVDEFKYPGQPSQAVDSAWQRWRRAWTKDVDCGAAGLKGKSKTTEKLYGCREVGYAGDWCDRGGYQGQMITKSTKHTAVSVLQQEDFPVPQQECLVETMGSLGAASPPSPPSTLPTLRRCLSRPRTCWHHLWSAGRSPMCAAPSASLWHSTFSSSPSFGLLSLMWMWVLWGLQPTITLVIEHSINYAIN